MLTRIGFEVAYCIAAPFISIIPALSWFLFF